MKSQIIKFVALLALLAGGLSISAQNNRTSSAFAIDKNIISFDVANLVDKRICEYLPEPGWGSPEGFSPHMLTITLFMAEGTDITSLAPIIKLAPGATIKSIETSAPGVTISPEHKGALDFSHQVDYIIITEDGSIVKYKFLATAEGKTRGYTVRISTDPASGGGTTSPTGTINNTDYIFVSALPNSPSYGFDKWLVTESGFTSSYYSTSFSKVLNNNIDILAVFKPNPQYTVTVQSENTNKGTVSGGGTCYANGSVYISASPNLGYSFDGWYLNGSKISSSQGTYYYPTASCILVAKFIEPYTVTLQSEDTNKGTVYGGGTCNPGSNVYIDATPKSGWGFEGWYLNGLKISSMQSDYYKPSASCTLIAKFKAQYMVILQSEDTNKGTVSGGGTCYSGGYVYIDATPKSGWGFEGWYLNGSKASSSASFNYYPSASCTLIAKFNQLLPPITGPDEVCYSGSQFTLNNPPSGTIYWTVSITSIFSINSSGNPTTVTRIGTGTGSVTISARTGSTSGPVIATKTIKPCIPFVYGTPLECGSTATYYVHNLPLGITNNDITWTYSPLLTPQGGNKGQSKTFTITDHGTGWVQATIAPLNYTTAEKEIILSFPSTKVEYIRVPCGNGIGMSPDNTYFNFSNGNNKFYRWDDSENTPGTYNFVVDYNGYSAYADFSANGMYYFYAYINHDCGESDFPTHIFLIDVYGCRSPSTTYAYPNPVDNILNVDLDALNEQGSQISSNVKQINSNNFYDVRLYNVQGNMLLQQKAGKGILQLNVSNIPNGYYFLHIYDGVSPKPEKQLIIVQH